MKKHIFEESSNGENYIDCSEIRATLHSIDILYGREVQNPTFQELVCQIRTSPTHFKDMICSMLTLLVEYENSVGVIPCNYDIQNIQIIKKSVGFATDKNPATNLEEKQKPPTSGTPMN